MLHTLRHWWRAACDFISYWGIRLLLILGSLAILVVMLLMLAQRG